LAAVVEHGGLGGGSAVFDQLENLGNGGLRLDGLCLRVGVVFNLDLRGQRQRSDTERDGLGTHADF
jgi:hypothetical protein